MPKNFTRSLLLLPLTPLLALAFSASAQAALVSKRADRALSDLNTAYKVTRIMVAAEQPLSASSVAEAVRQDQADSKWGKGVRIAASLDDIRGVRVVNVLDEEPGVVRLVVPYSDFWAVGWKVSADEGWLPSEVRIPRVDSETPEALAKTMANTAYKVAKVEAASREGNFPPMRKLAKAIKRSEGWKRVYVVKGISRSQDGQANLIAGRNRRSFTITVPVPGRAAVAVLRVVNSSATGEIRIVPLLNPVL